MPDSGTVHGAQKSFLMVGDLVCGVAMAPLPFPFGTTAAPFPLPFETALFLSLLRGESTPCLQNGDLLCGRFRKIAHVGARGAKIPAKVEPL